jgi:hypothetical protein
VKKFRKIKKFMCGKESFLVFYFFLVTLHSLILSFFILSLCVCDSKKINLCEEKEGCIYKCVFF